MWFRWVGWIKSLTFCDVVLIVIECFDRFIIWKKKHVQDFEWKLLNVFENFIECNSILYLISSQHNFDKAVFLNFLNIHEVSMIYNDNTRLKNIIPEFVFLCIAYICYICSMDYYFVWGFLEVYWTTKQLKRLYILVYIRICMEFNQ